MIGSFNAFGQTRKEFGNPSTPIWLGTVTPVPMGGSLDSAFVKSRALYPAGTPVNLTDKVIKPIVLWVVSSFAAGETNDTVVVKPCVYGGVNFIPSAGDNIMVLGASFAATGKGAAVVSAVEGEEGVTITVAHGALDAVSANKIIVLANGAGSGKKPALAPNHYLYNDIAMGEIDPSLAGAGASGACVRFHSEGILIKRTPGAVIADILAEAIPGVLQVNA